MAPSPIEAHTESTPAFRIRARGAKKLASQNLTIGEPAEYGEVRRRQAGPAFERTFGAVSGIASGETAWVTGGSSV